VQRSAGYGQDAQRLQIAEKDFDRIAASYFGFRVSGCPSPGQTYKSCVGIPGALRNQN
jgi:hypothetical protein